MKKITTLVSSIIIIVVVILVIVSGVFIYKYYSTKLGAQNSSDTLIQQPGISAMLKNTNTLTASPTIGKSPLQIIFSGKIDSKINGSGPFTIDFGDGPQKNFPIVELSATEGGSQYAISPVIHTYKLAGSYIAQLKTASCSGTGYQNFSCTPGSTIGAVMVTVR